jgi:fumarate reductase (CoM/CoB) subunit A
MERIQTDILIIGGGLTAMMAALEVSPSALPVLVACKARAGNSGATLMAGSNFAAVLPDAEEKGDRVSLHMEDTLVAGARLNDSTLVEILARRAPQDLLSLEAWGVPFLKKDGRFDLRKPPGHRNPRTVFTLNPGYPISIRGKSITAPLLHSMQQKKIPILDGVGIVKLLIQDGALAGALGIRRRTGERVAIGCKAAVIASGGGGFLYEINTNPSDVTGDSYSLALEAGCSLRDMEFVQFYPCLYLGPPRFPIYSPILSDGAVLRNRDGERFLARYEPERMEMATRDAVSQAIFREVRDGRGIDGGVYMDLTAVPPDLMSFRFPDLLAQFKKLGIDIQHTWIRVAPAAHFFMGGVVMDEDCRTSVPGLWAAGEAAGGLHGANRLSGNGLSDPMVFGRIAGGRAAEYARRRKAAVLPERMFALPWGTRGDKIPRRAIEDFRKKIKHAMGEQVGIIRDGPGLQAALRDFKDWQAWLEERQPGVPEALSPYYEVRSMLLAAQAVASAALFRQESRGAHFREDFPKQEKEWAGSISVRLEGGAFRLSRMH